LHISVVVPTRNRIDTLREVVPTLLAQTLDRARYEIVIADSRSDDGTAEYLAGLRRELPPELLRHLPGDYASRAAARNAGAAASRAPIILFTDADIMASRDLLERHVADHVAAGERHVGVVGCELRVNSLDDYRRQLRSPENRRPLQRPWRRRLSWLYFLTGNASLRRDDFDAVGGFDEAFTGYGHEDLELGYRLRKSGVEIIYDRDAVNYHWHPVGYAEEIGRMELAGASTVRFYRKHRDFEVKLKLGMTPISLGLHSLLSSAAGLRRSIERAAIKEAAPRKNTWPFVARQIAYQYHYLNGVKRALREPDGVKAT